MPAAAGRVLPPDDRDPVLAPGPRSPRGDRVPRRGDRYGREGVTGLPPRARSEVEVVAHRGVSAEAPEHTLAAYRQALALGADAVECDVRMTRDGVLVCVHDRRINRTIEPAAIDAVAE